MDFNLVISLSEPDRALLGKFIEVAQQSIGLQETGAEKKPAATKKTATPASTPAPAATTTPAATKTGGIVELSDLKNRAGAVAKTVGQPKVKALIGCWNTADNVPCSTLPTLDPSDRGDFLKVVEDERFASVANTPEALNALIDEILETGEEL